MRVSVDPSDPGFNSTAFGTKVWLDGEPVRDCVTADDECGEVFVFQRDDDGHLVAVPDPDKPWDFVVARERLEGRVEIQLPDSFKP